MICHKLSHLCGMSPHELGKAQFPWHRAQCWCVTAARSILCSPARPAVPVTLTGHRLSRPGILCLQRNGGQPPHRAQTASGWACGAGTWARTRHSSPRGGLRPTVGEEAHVSPDSPGGMTTETWKRVPRGTEAWGSGPQGAQVSFPEAHRSLQPARPPRTLPALPGAQ